MFRGQAAGTQFSYLKSGLGIIGHQIKSLWDKISTCRQWRSGPYAAFLKGGLHGGVAQIGMMWALAHSPPRRVWGHVPPEDIGNLDSLRAILRHSDSDLQFQIG